MEKVAELETLSACPICQSGPTQLAPLQPQPPFGIQQCLACKMVFLSPRPPAAGMKDYYDEFYSDKQDRDPRQERRAQRHLRRLNRHFVRPGRVLEIGAGDGYFLHAARDAGWEIEGLELSAPRVQHAQEWFGLPLQNCDLMAAALKPATFDAVVMLQLIEHMHDPAAVLRKVRSLLRPGGILTLSTPNILAYARKDRGVDSWRIPRHLFFFTPRTLMCSAEACGFKVISQPLKTSAWQERVLGWQPWPGTGLLSRITRDLWTPFGLTLVARAV
jgi:SAM-dependent methyltransferase